MKILFGIHKSNIRLKLYFAIKEFIIIAIVAIVIAMSFNFLRSSYIPLLGFSSAKLTKQQQVLIPEISIRDAFDLYSKKKVIFVDARDPLSFAEGHIAGAINIYPDEVSIYLPLLKTMLSNDSIIITYCDGPQCPLSKETAHALLQQGIPAVKVLVNGWQLWLYAGYPTAKGKI